MPNLKVKIVYSLRIHIGLQQLGFSYMTEMKNPKNPHLNCWVYQETPALLKAFDSLVKEG
jgi:hypothetical protein